MPPSPPEAPPGPTESPDDESRFFYDRPLWQRLYGYVLGPLLVGAVAIGIYTTARISTQEAPPPAELLATLRSGGGHERWQAAFGLTRYLDARADDPQALAQAAALVPEILTLLDEAPDSDAPMRRYLALALGQLRDPRALDALGRAAQGTDAELTVNAVAALAMIGDSRATPAVLSVSRHERPEVRSTAAFALGIVGTAEALPRLRQLLEDDSPAVRWNAAFALARQGDPSGEPVLSEILARGPLHQAKALSPAERREQFLNAIRAAGMVRTPALSERLREIARSDDDLEARRLARRLVDAATTGQP